MRLHGRRSRRFAAFLGKVQAGLNAAPTTSTPRRRMSPLLQTLVLGTVLSGGLLSASAATAEEAAARLTLAHFSADVTIPLGHRCMGVLPTKSRSIADPLEAHGFVLRGAGAPIVFVAVDWCEIRNGAYDQWRDRLAQAAGTVRERVLVTALHQHDAPVVDSGAAALLAEVGLSGELYDEAFHARVLERVAKALLDSLSTAVPVTHVGMGAAPVREIASNRRVVLADGRVTFHRGSRSAGDPALSAAPEGEIDPLLRTLSFWDGETPLLALSVYATHPMSRYGQGVVSADFVGLARRRREADLPQVHQVYASGCSGDVTAGKYNDGSDAAREGLIARLHAGMAAAWEATRRVPLSEVRFRTTPLTLEFYDHPELSPERLRTQLADPGLRTEDRILAALGLSSHQRVQAGRPIDFCCVDFGPAKLILFPGETFVAYQLAAQRMAPDAFVVSVGYGECWPGYLPTDAAFADGFHDKWLWVPPGSEQRLRRAMEAVLQPR